MRQTGVARVAYGEMIVNYLKTDRSEHPPIAPIVVRRMAIRKQL